MDWVLTELARISNQLIGRLDGPLQLAGSCLPKSQTLLRTGALTFVEILPGRFWGTPGQSPLVPSSHSSPRGSVKRSGLFSTYACRTPSGYELEALFRRRSPGNGFEAALVGR
jgi:hypothetical protein